MRQPGTSSSAPSDSTSRAFAAFAPSQAAGDERSFLIIAVGISILAALPRLWAAWFDQGVFWPDEIFQSVEQAHRLVFGYGIVPWEFVKGARSWVFPGMVAMVLKAGALLGLDSGQSLMYLIKTAMALLSLLTLWMTMRLARQLAGPRAALLAGAFGGFFSISLLLSSRCLSEMATAPVLLGSYMLTRGDGRSRQLLAGTLSGLAICMRYQSGVVACGLLAILVSEKRYRAAVWFASGASVVGILGGMLDWFTWGKPFSALKMYLYFNLKKSGAKFGVYPFTYYFTVAWTAAGPAVLAIASGLLWSVRLAPRLFLVSVGYVLLHCVIPHKEWRFLMPVMPMVFALAGAGLADALARVHNGRVWAWALAAVSALSMCFYATRLTWARVGFPSDRGARSPWHSGEGINRLLARAGTRDDVCGLMVTGESFGWIGAYSYFHRDVDLYPGTTTAEQLAANYLIAPASKPPLPGYREVDRARGSLLLRREGGCGPAPAGYRRQLGL
jgi:hypothetical protein